MIQGASGCFFIFSQASFDKQLRSVELEKFGIFLCNIESNPGDHVVAQEMKEFFPIFNVTQDHAVVDDILKKESVKLRRQGKNFDSSNFSIPLSSRSEAKKTLNYHDSLALTAPEKIIGPKHSGLLLY